MVQYWETAEKKNYDFLRNSSISAFDDIDKF